MLHDWKVATRVRMAKCFIFRSRETLVYGCLLVWEAFKQKPSFQGSQGFRPTARHQAL